MTDDPADADLAARLASWQPTPLDRDRMLYAAGAASARARGRERLWALALAASLLASIGLGVQLHRERQGRRDTDREGILANTSVRTHSPIVPFVPPVMDADRQRVTERRVIEMVERLNAVPDGPDSEPPIRLRDFKRLLEL